MVKQYLIMFLIFLMLFIFSIGCRQPKPNEIEKINIAPISPQRMLELIEANNTILSAIQGTSNFKNISELKQYAQNFYTQDVLSEYLTDKTFLTDNNTLHSPILKKEKINKKTIDYQVSTKSIEFINNTQMICVCCFDSSEMSNLKFTTTYNEPTQNWVLTSILFTFLEKNNNKNDTIVSLL